MTKNTKLGNDDNGTVLTAEEAILSGVASNRPQDICTKYPEKCTELQVAADDCGNCCNIVKPAMDNCPKIQEKLLYRVTIEATTTGPKVLYYARMYNPSDVAITNIKINVLCSATCQVPFAGQGSEITVIEPGTREWLWTMGSLAPHAEAYIRIKTRYKGYSMSLTPKADAPAELTEDSVLFCKHII